MLKADCIFCQIISKNDLSKTIINNDSLIVIPDLHPKAPTHYLIIPKNHYAQADQADSAFFSLIPETLKQIISQNDYLNNNYKLVINNGRAAGQEIMHLHIHLLSNALPGHNPTQGR